MGQKKPDIRQWSSSDVTEWLHSRNLSDFVEEFKKEQIDGETLLQINDNDLKIEFKMTLGQRKNFMLGISQL